MAAKTVLPTRIGLDEETNRELARHVETERQLARFEYSDGEVLVLDGAGDVRASSLVAALKELIETTPDSGAGLYIEMEVGPARLRFRVLASYEVPPTVFYCIGAGAVMLRYEAHGIFSR
ncbi:MAG TPA: hypothetical protein VHB21_22535 [Minicystis sp.]|nr:hypothetical protein [Minicystis sp.]